MPVLPQNPTQTEAGPNIAPHRIHVPPQPSSSTGPRLPQAKETYIAGLATACILLHLALRYFFHTTANAWLAPLYVTLLFGGLPLIVGLTRRVLAREFGSDLLAGISIVTSVLLGEYLVGAIVVLMLSGGTALEHFAARRASSVLDALARRMPNIAHRKRDSDVVDVTLDDIAIGDSLIVFPHEICPVDGVVVDGQGVMDEAYLTGEPFVISKTPGTQVLSGAVNGETALTVRAEKLPVDSRYAKIMQVMRQLEQNRPRLRRLGDRLGAWYTPVAVALAAAAWALSGNALRFLAVLVIATPCPLLIAIPVAVIGAISLSAARGIIIKNPAVLEQIDCCRTLIFDKTGTLTYGEPSLTEIRCAPGFAKDEILRLAACLERYSKHPLASAILSAAREAKLELEPASQISERPGEGLRGIVGGRRIQITGRAKVAATADFALPPVASGLECLVFLDGVYAGLFRFHDAPRKGSRLFVSHLWRRHRVNRVMLISGDRESEVRYLAEMVGIKEVHAGKSPEEKVALVTEEVRKGPTLFVGDGINDAPSLMVATVGVAFGQASDITSEAADVVILENSLEKIDEMIHIGRRMRAIALQSAVGGMVLSIVGMIAAATGFLVPVEGAIAQEIIDLVAVLNAVRMAMPFGGLTDY
jgi:heavy metal translocating P-type ATPase